MRSLKPFQGDHSNDDREPFAVVDIETSRWVRFLVAGYFDGATFRTFRRLRGLFDFLLGADVRTIYAHFGGNFDFLFFLRQLLREKNWKINYLIPRGSGILSFEVEVCRGSQAGKRIVFRDSSALLPFALRSLTENFNVAHKKGVIDYEKIERVTPELLDYLESDCRGLYEVLEKYFAWPLIAKAGIAPTVAGQAIKILRTFIDDEFISVGKKVDAFVRRGYFGGRTEIFKPYYHDPEKPLYCYDVNSLFPFIMASTPMPGNFVGWTRERDLSAIGFFEAEVDVPDDLYIPPLGVKHDGKYIFPTGRVSGVFSTAELRYAEKLGCKIVRTGWGALFQNRGLCFTDFVEALHEIKARAARGSVDATIAKLILNACYGRTGIRRDREKIIFDQGERGAVPFRDVKVLGKTVTLAKLPTEVESFSNVAIAAWITANARIHMHRLMRSIDYDVYYTDTDSLFTPRELPTGEGLGELKLEYKSHAACFLLPKTYVAVGDKKKIVMKGFDRKKIQSFEFEDFRHALEGDFKRLAVVVEPRFAKFRTALAQGKLVTMTKPSRKAVKSVYSKRIIFQDSLGVGTATEGWNSRPLKLKPKIEKEKTSCKISNSKRSRCRLKVSKWVERPSGG